MAEPEDRAGFVATYNALAADVHQNAKEKGFWEKERNDGEILMLIVSELSEGLEYLRKSGGQSTQLIFRGESDNKTGCIPSDHLEGFAGIEEELADVIIRVMDYGHVRGYRVANAVIAKTAYNRGRLFKHGKAS